MSEYVSQAQEVLGFKLFDVGEAEVTVLSILLFIFFQLLFFLLGLLVQRALRDTIFKKYELKHGIDESVARLARYTIIIIGFFFSIQFIGISIASLAVVFGLLSVGIGFGLQNVTSNFIAGLILLFERPVKIDDRIKVGEVIGEVKEIRIRTTVVNTPDNIDILIPNSQLISENVVNWTYRDLSLRLNVDVGVSYGSDVEKVKAVLLDVAKANNDVMDSPTPYVFFNDFGDSSLDFRLAVWVREPLRNFQILSDIRFAIVRAFRENEIEIPFPQRDLHVRSGLESVISGR